MAQITPAGLFKRKLDSVYGCVVRIASIGWAEGMTCCVGSCVCSLVQCTACPTACSGCVGCECVELCRRWTVGMRL